MSSIIDHCAELEAKRNRFRARLKEAVENQPLIECPKCGAEYEDFDGFGVLYCPKCGYCQHASVTDGKCDYCGQQERDGKSC